MAISRGDGLDGPDFLVIGGQRCGTSTLHGHLKQHPDIFMPWSRKEIHYYDRFYHKGPHWYASFFKDCHQKCKGDITPAYLYFEACAQRIYQANPNSKLIAILRNPIERAYSQFKFTIRETGYEGDFESFLCDFPDARERGLYYRQLNRYLDLFPADHLKIVLFEDLIQHPAEVLRQLYTFIGVDAEFTPEGLMTQANAGRIPRFHKLYVFTKKITATLHGRQLSWLVAVAKALGVRKMFFGSKQEDRELPPLREDQYRSLVDYYNEDLALLSEFLGEDMRERWDIGVGKHE